MSTLNYINVIERYHEFREAIHALLGSILSGISEENLFHNKATQCRAMQCLGENYPFVDLMYVLDENGVQTGDNVAVSSQHPLAYQGKGSNRRHRPYFQLAQQSREVVVTEPYLSTASRKLCLSAATRLDREGRSEFLVLDVDLARIVEFLMGDTARRRFQPFFKSIYGLIIAGLFVVVGILLFHAGKGVAVMFGGSEAGPASVFHIIIFLTLGLAIFDLGKTTLEEEILMHKDVFRHSSTRRTITRFMSAILVAVSIEALLLMFKAALGQTEQLIHAVWMMLAALGLLTSLGVYVYLGAKAEALLIDQGHRSQQRRP